MRLFIFEFLFVVLIFFKINRFIIGSFKSKLDIQGEQNVNNLDDHCENLNEKLKISKFEISKIQTEIELYQKIMETSDQKVTESIVQLLKNKHFELQKFENFEQKNKMQLSECLNDVVVLKNQVSLAIDKLKKSRNVVNPIKIKNFIIFEFFKITKDYKLITKLLLEGSVHAFPCLKKLCVDWHSILPFVPVGYFFGGFLPFNFENTDVLVPFVQAFFVVLLWSIFVNIIYFFTKSVVFKFSKNNQTFFKNRKILPFLYSLMIAQRALPCVFEPDSHLLHSFRVGFLVTIYSSGFLYTKTTALHFSTPVSVNFIIWFLNFKKPIIFSFIFCCFLFFYVLSVFVKKLEILNYTHWHSKQIERNEIDRTMVELWLDEARKFGFLKTFSKMSSLGIFELCKQISKNKILVTFEEKNCFLNLLNKDATVSGQLSLVKLYKNNQTTKDAEIVENILKNKNRNFMFFQRFLMFLGFLYIFFHVTVVYLNRD